jgi:cytochrome P450
MTDTLGSVTAVIEFARFEEIREALFNPDLSRTFDRRSYEEGNIRDGIVSTSHGAVHRARRRVENTQFRPDRLREYEKELFPGIMRRLLDRLIDAESVDLFPLGELLAVVLAARRAGLDPNLDDLPALRRLVEYVDAFSQGSAILDARDPDAVRALVRAALASFEREFVRPAWNRRAGLIDRVRRGELERQALPHDILTVLLLHRDEPNMALDDDGRIVREVATYLQGGTHTSSQTLINALDLLFPRAAQDPAILARVATDPLFAQRCVHETLRLRPTTPKIKRHAETDTIVAGKAVPRGALVVLDVARANRDPALFGPHADEFDPDRTLDPDIPRWGLSFGAGPHQCPGRLVAGGLPVPEDGPPDGDHLFGLVALMLQEIVRRGVAPDPARPSLRDDRTERFTRWRSYPVVFRAPVVVGATP